VIGDVIIWWDVSSGYCYKIKQRSVADQGEQGLVGAKPQAPNLAPPSPEHHGFSPAKFPSLEH